MAEAQFTFPRGFLWGTATAAHQVEGDNRLNDWWAFEQRREGRFYQDQVSGPACEWWSGRAEEDIQRMAALNTKAHRMSIEWSRIEPRPGQWNYDAIDRYRQILGAMRSAGITPMVTLHHFTNPQWMAERGGWTHPEAPQWYSRYAEKAVSELADLCDLWCTINEPNVYAGNAYFTGKWPPGQESLRFYFQVLHNLIKGHAGAYHLIKDVQPNAQVGLAKNLADWHPLNPNSPLDRLVTNQIDRYSNTITLDALQTGAWKPLLGRSEALPEAAGTLDWVGLNFYFRCNAAFDLRRLRDFGIYSGTRPEKEQGPDHWGELSPSSLWTLIKRLWDTLEVPIFITENGMPEEEDKRRPSHLLQSLRWVWHAVMLNVPVKGYFYWSLVDNFEWSEAYDPRFRFGLYGVDFTTQERTLRPTGELYAEICAANAFTTDMVRRYAPDYVEDLFPGRGPS